MIRSETAESILTICFCYLFSVISLITIPIHNVYIKFRVLRSLFELFNSMNCFRGDPEGDIRYGTGYEDGL